MKKLTCLSAVVLMVLPALVNAQDAADALRYSNTTFGGTARFMAMGGAFSAVGGDMSSLTFNPAGIGVFTKSQLTFSPGFSFQSTSSQYNGQTNMATQSSGNVQNAGLVLAWKSIREESMWKGIALGFVYNRTNNFNTQLYTQGNNYNSTMLDQYTDEANGTYYKNLDLFYTNPAFQTGLLDTNAGAKSYYNIIRPYLNSGNYVTQQKSLTTTGSMGETDISFGGNYNNTLYIGASVGLPDIYYNENTIYSETPSYVDNTFGLTSYTINSSVATSGGGVNFKLGFIYRPLDWLRIGAAVHTPTVFSLSDEYSTGISANYIPGSYSLNNTASNQSPAGSFNYTLVTPMKVMGGVAFVIHKQAILSADYEYLDYSTASFSASGNSYSSVNQEIANSYMGASNIRVGGEYVLYPFSIRAGYTYYGNPYTQASDNTSLKRSLSAGVGVRIRHCFIDLAYVYSYYNTNDFLYYSAYGNAIAQNSTTESNVVLTMGVNF
ncbi:MAG TPA: hypothetical protein VK783_15125 [Bacteroidia bacterium]|jgi:hypothetical protein|nr:hypothetical protein [Bacteroidia bacterium]